MKHFAALRPACLLMALALFFAPCVHAQETPELLEPVGVQINAVKAFVGELSSIAVHEASVIPYTEAFFFEQEGTVDEVHVIPGQLVQAGDVLATLDTEAEDDRIRSLQQEIGQLETIGSYAREIALVDLDILALELRALKAASPRDENAIRLKQLDIEQKQLEMETDQAVREVSLLTLRSELEALESASKLNVLRAPFDGRVMFLAEELVSGNYVSAFTPLVYLADDTRLFVESEYIPSHTLNAADALYALVGSRRYSLIAIPVDEREYLAKALTGETLMQQFEILDADDSLAAGQYAVVCVQSGLVPDALIVPTNALYTDTERYLYVVENGVRVRREVHTGASTPWHTQILEGLEEGELVYVPE